MWNINLEVSFLCNYVLQKMTWHISHMCLWHQDSHWQRPAAPELVSQGVSYSVVSELVYDVFSGNFILSTRIHMLWHYERWLVNFSFSCIFVLHHITNYCIDLKYLKGLCIVAHNTWNDEVLTLIITWFVLNFSFSFFFLKNIPLRDLS